MQEANNLEVDKAKRMERIRAKTQQLQDLILQASRVSQLGAMTRTIKFVLYRDTVSVEPGSRPFLDSLCLKRHIYGCRSVSRVEDIHFAYTNYTFSVSTGFETVSESVLRLWKDMLMCVEHNLEVDGAILAT